jgi:hypothetical protein
MSSLNSAFSDLKTRITALDQQYQSITQEQWNTLNGEAVAIRATVRARYRDLQEAAKKEYDALPQIPTNYGEKVAIRQYEYADNALTPVTNLSEEIRKLLKDLANKISVRAASNSYSGAG